MSGANRTKSEPVQDERYARAAASFGPALQRLSRAYEADADLRRDLLQEIHFALWRSFAVYDGRCSERTWVYRVAHNVAASHVLKARRSLALTTLDEIAAAADPAQANPEAEATDREALDRLTAMVQALAPPDRQIVVLYLEGLEASAIGEVCGLTQGAVAVKIHRLKAVLARRFEQAGSLQEIPRSGHAQLSEPEPRFQQPARAERAHRLQQAQPLQHGGHDAQ